MVNVNRKELNRRFKRVFDLLVEKDVIVKNDRKRSKSAFAEKLGTKGHIIDLFLKEKRCITYEQAKKLCENFQVNEAYLFQGIGEPFEKINLPDPEKRLAAVLGISFSPNILFTSVEAFASNTVGVDLLEENEWFRIPGISGDLVAFNINGDSMAPTIRTGDMVICAPLETDDELIEDEVYAVVTNQSVWVKRIQRCYDHFGNWTHVRMISDNHEEFDPFIIERSEVRKLLAVRKRLTGIG
jgi:phage repressor protein C with HTH and peptisase S24 domain